MAKGSYTDENKQEFDVNLLKGKTPAQAEDWIENNVTDLASAKDALKTIAKFLVAIVNSQG